MKVNYQYISFLRVLELTSFLQVYLPAIFDHVLAQMVRALASVLDSCHLIRRSRHTGLTLVVIDDAPIRFHRDRIIFETEGIRVGGLSLPRQHSLVHYK